MNLPSDDIIRILPRLRRYASALTGSRRSGDEYIRIALEALVEEPWRLPPESQVKPELYALLHETLRACRYQDRDEQAGLDDIDDARQRLRQLALADRELLLLVDLEGFPLGDAAELVDLTGPEAEWRLAAARWAYHASPPEISREVDATDAGSRRPIAGWLAGSTRAAANANHQLASR